MATRIEMSVVVPVFRSERFLEDLLEEFDDHFRDFPGVLEVVLVDDSSPDNSWQVIQKIVGHSYENVSARALRLPKNLGQHRAIGYGVANSQGELIATVDADLQEGLHDLRKLWEEITRTDVDVAQSIRVVDINKKLITLPSKIYFKILRVLTGSFGLQNYGSLSIFRSHLKQNYLIWNRKGLHHNAALEMISDRRVRVGVAREMRDGPSSYNLRKRVQHAVAGLRGHEARVASVVNGFAFITFLAATMALCTSLFLQFLRGGVETPIGWLSIMSFMSLNSFLNLVSLRLSTSAQKVFSESESVEVLQGSSPISSI